MLLGLHALLFHLYQETHQLFNPYPKPYSGDCCIIGDFQLLFGS